MNGVATQEQVDNLCKKVAELTELAEKKSAEHEGTVKKLLEEVLANHPGFTPVRKTEFPEAGPTKHDEIIDSLNPELQEQHDNIFILSKALRKDPRSLKAWRPFVNRIGDFKKALDTAAAAGGGDWVPTGFSAQLYEFVRLQTKVAALFPQINMPTNPYVLPIGIGRGKSYKHAEQTADTGQDVIPKLDASVSLTGKTTLTAVGHATMVLISKDTEEDAIVPMLPYLRSEIISTLAEGREDAIVNGDTAGSHEDTDVSAADDRRKLWLGLRAHANDQSYKSDLGEFTLTTIRNGLRGNMGKYGVTPGNLAYITGIKGYLKLLSLTDVTTVDKYGPGATILSGELAKLDGIPVIVSEWVREDLDTTGIYGSGQTKTALSLVYRNGFCMGVRREASIQLLTELYAAFDQDALKTKERVTFSPIHPIASNKTTYLGYNIG